MFAVTLGVAHGLLTLFIDANLSTESVDQYTSMRVCFKRGHFSKHISDVIERKIFSIDFICTNKTCKFTIRSCKIKQMTYFHMMKFILLSNMKKAKMTKILSIFISP